MSNLITNTFENAGSPPTNYRQEIRDFFTILLLELELKLPFTSLLNVPQLSLNEVNNNFIADLLTEQLILAMNLGNLIAIEKIIELGIKWLTQSS